MNSQNNWQTLKKKLSSQTQKIGKSAHVKAKLGGDTSKKLLRGSEAQNNQQEEDKNISPSVRAKYIALDCEMVGLGPGGKKSALARCSVVSFDGDVLYDRFVRPKGFVTDFRTKYSGVRQQDLRQGEACTFEECQEEVAKLIKGKILVGHALQNDLDVLMLSHSRSHIRDTAYYRPLMRKIGTDTIKYRSRALKDLSKQYLATQIQDGEHDPSVDARAAMMLYRKFRTEWEQNLKIKKTDVTGAKVNSVKRSLDMIGAENEDSKRKISKIS